LKKAHEIKAQKLEADRNDTKQKINEIISKMDEPKLNNALELITKLNNSEMTKERHALYTTIDGLTEMEVKSFLTKCAIQKAKSKAKFFLHICKIK